MVKTGTCSCLKWLTINSPSGKITTAFTGYSYFPMPFWKKVHMFVENQEKHTITFCHQLKVEEKTESQEDMGYFGGHQAYFIGNQRGKSKQYC